MNTFIRTGIAAAAALVLSSGLAMAQNGNPCPGSKEYQFNIIGVAKGKKPDMKGNSGHRIFVWLNKKSRIFMTGDTDPGTAGLQCGDSFQITDANATDDGDEATLVVPCDPLTADNLTPDVCFDVFATPLGKPGGHADVEVVCEFDDTCLGCNIDDVDGDCATGTMDFTLVRNSGKPVQQDITKYLRASGCIDLGGEEGVCDTGDLDFKNEWIFNIEQLLTYYWDYDNDGLRIAQIRFCDVEGVEGSDCGPNVIL